MMASLLPLSAAELKPATLKAYESYVESIDRSLENRKNYLLIDEVPGMRQRVRGGEVFIEERRPQTDPPDGLIHHWMGAIFMPGATLGKVLATLQDYDQHQRYFAPEVIRSKTLEHNGNHFRIELRLLKKKVITAVLDTEHSVDYRLIDSTRAESRSRSLRVQEVDNAGEPSERLLPEGTGHGFVWRLDSFWRFLEADGGVYLECTSLTLSRSIPFGLSRIIRPIIDDLPEESLRNVLTRSRDAVK